MDVTQFSSNHTSKHEVIVSRPISILILTAAFAASATESSDLKSPKSINSDIRISNPHSAKRISPPRRLRVLSRDGRVLEAPARESTPHSFKFAQAPPLPQPPPTPQPPPAPQPPPPPPNIPPGLPPSNPRPPGIPPGLPPTNPKPPGIPPGLTPTNSPSPGIPPRLPPTPPPKPPRPL